MLTNVSVADLHAMDLAAHIHLMEEWNEESFHWQEATVTLLGYVTIVTQDDGNGGFHVAVYLSGGEGDLISLRVYTNKNPQGQRLYHPEDHQRQYRDMFGHDDQRLRKFTGLNKA